MARCVSLDKLCDGVTDCPASDDEEDCGECTKNDQDNIERLVSLDNVCDRVTDCTT